MQVFHNVARGYLAPHQRVVLGTGRLYVNIEKSLIAGDVAHGIDLFNIQVIEDLSWIDETITLSVGIAQTGFRQPVFQSCRHTVDRVLLGKIQGSHAFQVLLNAVDVKGIG